MTAPLRVVIVDDVADQRELLRTHLERAGCVVRECVDAADVERALRDEQVDVAIVDLMMPGVDGWALAARIREDSPSTVVVVSSVLDQIDYPAGSLALPKPFTGRQVKQLVDELRRACRG